ncbi:MAG TPA: BON domain-containing protein [Solirubrobacteraceae bacterium]
MANGEGRDRQLEADVRSRLDRDDGWHVRSLARYEVAVADGRATLTGHVRQRSVATAMVGLARRVRGLSSVEERLVADDELVPRVASAIGRTALNRGSRLVVRAELGRVRIGGAYASAEARADAQRVGAEVPGVVAVTAARPSDLIV